jgi:heat shock protein 4
MFIDIGYSCYTVTIVDFIQEKLQVRATVCDKELGGRDFDDVIVKFLVETFKSKTGIDVSSNAKALLKLQAAAEKAKQTLSPAGVTDANVSVECLAEERDLNCLVKRDEFEARCANLVSRLREPIERCLSEAGLSRTDLSDCEIVGGSSRINIVKRTLSEILGLDASLVNYGLKTTMNSDEAVARGSTLQCAIVSSRIKVKPFNIIDKLYYPIVVEYESSGDVNSSKMDDGEDDGEAVEGSVKKNSSGGVDSVEIYSRGDDYPRKPRRLVFRNKTSNFVISTLYGPNAELPQGQSRHIGTHTIKIPDAYQNTPHDVRVTFTMDKHQCVSIQSAQLMEELPPLPKPEEKAGEEKKGDDAAPPSTEPEKKRIRKVDLEVYTETFGLTRSQIKDCIQAEAEMALADRIIIETSDRRNELEAYIYAMRDKLDGELKNYVTNSEKIQFREIIDKSETWLYDEGFDSTKNMYISKLEALRKMGDPIEKRMYEEVNRKEACDALKRQIEVVKAFSNNREEQYAHITSEERQTIRNEAESTEQWLYDELEKQGMLSSYNDPVLTVEILNNKRKSLIQATTGIMSKPKPKPAPKEEEKKDAKGESKGEEKNSESQNADAKNDDSKQDESGSVPMEECS